MTGKETNSGRERERERFNTILNTIYWCRFFSLWNSVSVSFYKHIFSVKFLNNWKENQINYTLYIVNFIFLISWFSEIFV